MTVMIADMIKRIPALSVVPLMVWALSMTIYVVAWKTHIEHQIEAMEKTSALTSEQVARVAAVEQSLQFVREDLQQIKSLLMKENVR